MKKIIFLAMVIATPFLGAAEWNFNDPSKLASGEVVVPGVSKFTASNNNLTTSNVVIGGGGSIGSDIADRDACRQVPRRQ